MNDAKRDATNATIRRVREARTVRAAVEILESLAPSEFHEIQDILDAAGIGIDYSEAEWSEIAQEIRSALPQEPA